MRFLLLNETEDGQKVSELEGATTMAEAVEMASGKTPNEYGDHEDELPFRVETSGDFVSSKAAVLHVTDMQEIDLVALGAHRRHEHEQRQKREVEQYELAEFERLKAKLGK